MRELMINVSPIKYYNIMNLLLFLIRDEKKKK